jgi:hypothetical protein
MTDNAFLNSEVALIRGIVGGETELYYQLIRPYHRMIYAAAAATIHPKKVLLSSRASRR